MNSSVDPIRHAQAMVGVAVRRGRDPLPARRALVVAKLRKHVQQALDSDTPPDASERRELAALLTGGDAR